MGRTPRRSREGCRAETGCRVSTIAESAPSFTGRTRLGWDQRRRPSQVGASAVVTDLDPTAVMWAHAAACSGSITRYLHSRAKRPLRPLRSGSNTGYLPFCARRSTRGREGLLTESDPPTETASADRQGAFYARLPTRGTPNTGHPRGERGLSCHCISMRWPNAVGSSHTPASPPAVR